VFDTQGMFFVMAVFLNQDKQDSTLDLPELLDFLQIGILFFLIYFGAYYLPAIRLTEAQAFAREFHVMTTETVGIFLLALLQWRRSATAQTRRLFGGLAAYVFLYGSLGALITRIQVGHEVPTGTWMDLGWSLPLLCAAFWATTWQPEAESKQRERSRNRTLS